MSVQHPAVTETALLAPAFLDTLSEHDRALPPNLLYIFQEHPDVDYSTALSILANDFTEPFEGEIALNDETYYAFISSMSRLSELLPNRYHDFDSHVTVSAGLLIDVLENLRESMPIRQIVLHLVAIFAHDLAHIGKPYRQKLAGQEGALGTNMSNEEFSVLVFMALAVEAGIFTREDLEQIIPLILATTFFQTRGSLPAEAPDEWARNYEDQRDDSGKIMAFIDVAYYLLGDVEWIEGGLRLFDEYDALPENVDKLLEGSHGFLNGYVRARLSDIEHLLTPEYYAYLVGYLEHVLARIAAAQLSGDEPNSDRTHYAEELARLHAKRG